MFIHWQAIALKLDPSIADKIKEVVFIGGTTEGRGNQTMVAEFNIHSDPEAADIVLSSMPPGVLTMVRSMQDFLRLTFFIYLFWPLLS